MQLLLKTAALSLAAFSSILPTPSFRHNKTSQPVQAPQANQPKIQAAILLDVSNSMDGLIEQAKTQLWNMVTVMGKATCENNVTPRLEIALYEYGRSTNNVKEGYVKKINGFISDLDSLSLNLFSLTTNGGDEFCGQVIYSSMDQLGWDVNSSSYKVIFIAGNEDFLQGNLHYTKACQEAKKKGVIVNTVYCGSRADGIREHWNLGAECGLGSFTNINQDAKIEDIPTPYDSLLFTYNEKLNQTYVAYGSRASYYISNQAVQDNNNAKMGATAGVKRIKAKSNSNVYNNAGWDLVDAKEKDGEGFLDKLDKKELPDSLRNKSKAELNAYVEQKSTERKNVQAEITKLNAQRDAYIAAERVKNASNKNNTATLETEVEKIIKEQVKRVNMKIE
ncbi:MAG TPA: VWA domain-containing protein [Ferruginibacter sp.]|nr:VWA domain-containing protein [Ferruginibacter sp.]